MKWKLRLFNFLFILLIHTIDIGTSGDVFRRLFKYIFRFCENVLDVVGMCSWHIELKVDPWLTFNVDSISSYYLSIQFEIDWLANETKNC